MKLTKYEHACLVLEKDDHALVIDPGNITDDFVAPHNVVATVITHEHPDHFDLEKLRMLAGDNPTMKIVAPASVTAAISDMPTQAVEPGDHVDAGPFSLDFFGGTHQLIYQTLPTINNVGVMVNDVFYYPGDSYALPEKPVAVLAAPTSGPWLAIGDVVDFIKAVHPTIVFSTHDAHSSEKNCELVDRLLPMLVADDSVHYRRLAEPLDIDE